MGSFYDSEQAAVKPVKKNRVAGTLNGLTIVVDPGHGGYDHGTIGVNGTAEKNVTQRTSEMLASKLRFLRVRMLFLLVIWILLFH